MAEKRCKQFWGIVNYEIIGDGSLNGIWTNNFEQRGGLIMNEIARKIDNSQNDIFEGEYYVSWIEPNQEPINGRLKIASIHSGELRFEWTINDNSGGFKGVGLRVGLNNIIAFYWKTDEKIHLPEE